MEARQGAHVCAELPAERARVFFRSVFGRNQEDAADRREELHICCRFDYYVSDGSSDQIIHSMWIKAEGRLRVRTKPRKPRIWENAKCEVNILKRWKFCS
ncbi:hypothetical protein AV530_011895 [Patagioenas fasciata monilis]|uniref:Uncharacterized protein n=1 Tax=Patagioenas fasciata monilis TaxID=372326 RepID=A0A1V4JU15_PATFA|nr:hypothetical protein AV530_011895 [Patagioenas fasciata monilis]